MNKKHFSNTFIFSYKNNLLKDISHIATVFITIHSSYYC